MAHPNLNGTSLFAAAAPTKAGNNAVKKVRFPKNMAAKYPVLANFF